MSTAFPWQFYHDDLGTSVDLQQDFCQIGAGFRIVKIYSLRQHGGVLNLRSKIILLADVPAWRQRWRASGQKLVVTNGCFDLLHPGHVAYLEAARNLGDALLVGLNSDASVQALKGPGRPVNNEQDRALVLAALESITGVSIFPDVRATEFLKISQPDIYVKGGDYTLETLNQEERRIVEQGGGRIELLPMVAGKSTTGLLTKLKDANPGGA